MWNYYVFFPRIEGPVTIQFLSSSICGHVPNVMVGCASWLPRLDIFKDLNATERTSPCLLAKRPIVYLLFIVATCSCVTWSPTRMTARTSAWCVNAASRPKPRCRTMWTCTTASNRTRAGSAKAHSPPLVSNLPSHNRITLLLVLPLVLNQGAERISAPQGGSETCLRTY